MASDDDTPTTGEVVELFAPRDLGTRRTLWNMLKHHPKRKLVIHRLRSTGNVLRFNQPMPPPGGAA